MSFNRNNLLFYHAPITTIGDVNSVLSAVGVCAKYDAMVIKPHTGADLANLKQVILALKTLKPAFKVFGYTDLGGSADLATWQAQVDQWLLDLPGTLTGIFIDKFGFENATATRANQNSAVDYVHTKLLSAFANATNLIDVMGQLSSQLEPTIGRSTTQRDYVLLNDFFFTNLNGAPGVEPKEQMYGRLEYAKGAKIKPGAGSYNVGFAASVGAGTGTSIQTDAYDSACVSASDYALEFLAVTPFDFGNPSHKYFYRYRSNTFSD